VFSYIGILFLLSIWRCHSIICVFCCVEGGLYSQMDLVYSRISSFYLRRTEPIHAFPWPIHEIQFSIGMTRFYSSNFSFHSQKDGSYSQNAVLYYRDSYLFTYFHVLAAKDGLYSRHSAIMQILILQRKNAPLFESALDL
jgi:hypothetical protein